VSSVDTRVVEMQFDNQQFEKGVQTSVKSLDDLKKGLDLEKSAKGLSALESAGRSFSLAGVANSVSTIEGRFTSLGIVGVTALTNITNSAINAGKQMLKSLTIDPVSSGFSKYEKETTSVQAIMNATGEGVDTVEGKIEKLGWFTDETSYDYSTMVDTLGKFVAAGSGLDESITAMEGIATAGALAGVSIDKTSIAYYNLAQAMAAGKVSALDWRSIEQAGMATKKFKQDAIDAAVASGTVIDLGDGNYISSSDKATANKTKNKSKRNDQIKKKSFTADSMGDHLESGWFDKNVLMTTLNKYGEYADAVYKVVQEQNVTTQEAMDIVDKNTELWDDPFKAAQEAKTFTDAVNSVKDAVSTGWKDTFKAVFGNYEEAKVLWTDLAGYLLDIFAESGNERNKMLKEWKELGGRNDLTDAFYNIMDSLENIIATVKGAISEIFPPMTANVLKSMTAGIDAFTVKIKAFTENTDKMDKVKSIFKGIAAIVDNVRMAISWLWDGFKKLIGIAAPAGGSILDLAAKVGDYLVAFHDAIKTSKTFQDILTTVGKVIVSVRGFVVRAGQVIGKVFGDLFEKLKNTGIFKKIGDGVNTFLGKIPQAIETLERWGKAVVDYVASTGILQKAWQKIKEFAGPAIQKIKEFAKWFGTALRAFFSADTSGITGFWEKLKARFMAMGTSFAGTWTTVKKKVTAVWESIKTFFAKLFGKNGDAEKELTNQNGVKVGLPIDTSNWFTILREKVGTVWSGIKAYLKNFFSKTVPDFFTKTVPNLMKSIPQVFGGLVEQLKTIDWGAVFNTAMTVLGGIAVLSLVKSISNIGKGFKSLSGLFDNFGKGAKAAQKGLGKFLGNFDKILKSFNTKTIVHKDSLGNNILKIATAIGILVAAIIVIGNTEDSKLQKGLTVLGILAVGMVALGVAFKKLGPEDSKGILQAAAALALLTRPVMILGNMKLDKLILGLGAVGLLLTFLVAFTQQAKGLGKSTGFVAMAVALNLLTIPIKILGSMDFDKLVLGLGAVGLLLTMLTMFTQQAKGLGKSTGFIAMAVALNLLIIPIKILGSMDFDKLVLGLGAVGLLLTFLVAFTQQAKGLGKSTGFIAMAVALNLLIIPIKILGSMDFDKLALGMGAIGVLLLGLSLFCKKTKTLGKSTGLIAMAVALNLLVIPIKTLGKMKPTDLAKGVGAISALLVIMGVFNKLSGTGNLQSASAQIVSMIGIAGVIVIFAESLTLIKGIPWQSIAAFSVGIVAVVGAMIASALLLKGIDPMSATKASAALAILSAGLGAAIEVLAGFVGNAAEGLSGNATTIVSNLQIYSNMADKVKYDAIGKSITAIENLADMMVTVGSKNIGKFDDFSSQLTSLGARLYLFNLGISGIAAGGADNAVAMVDDIDTIGSKMVEMQKKGYDLDAMGSAISTFGADMELYATSMNDANGLLKDDKGKKVASADDLTGMFTEMAKVDLPQETINRIAKYGENNGAGLQGFSEGLIQIGDAVQGYAVSIKDISLLDAIKSDIVLGMINNLQNNLPTVGNELFSWINGKQETLDDFATSLVTLGGGLTGLNDGLKNFDNDTAIVVTDTLGKLIDVQQKLKIQNSLTTFLGPKGDLGEFGNTLNVMGEGFRLYVGSLEAFAKNTATVNNATTALQKLSDVQNSLAKSGVGAQLNGGSQDLGTFGAQLKTLGDNFYLFSGAMAGVKLPTNMADIQTVIQSFADIAVQLKDVPNVGSGTYDLSSQIGWFGAHLKDFFSNDKGIGNVTVDNQKVFDIMTMVGNIADIAVKLNGITGGIDFDFLQSVLDGVNTLVIPSFVSAGGDTASVFVGGMANGIQNGTKTIATAAKNLATNGCGNARMAYPNWYTTGQYLAQGLGNGISSMAGRVRNAAVNVAAGAIRSIQMTWSVHSPSKVGNDLGMYFDLGIAGGLDGYSKVVTQSAADVGKNATESAKAMLGSFTANTIDGMDTAPTIRPVIDMSDVTNGVNTINGLFNANRSLNAGIFTGATFNRNAAKINMDGGRQTGTGDNRDVVNAIGTLTARFDNLSDAVANMKLVLDTGTLVGQMGAKMDKQLGVLAGRRDRGN